MRSGGTRFNAFLLLAFGNRCRRGRRCCQTSEDLLADRANRSCCIVSRCRIDVLDWRAAWPRGARTFRSSTPPCDRAARAQKRSLRSCSYGFDTASISVYACILAAGGLRTARKMFFITLLLTRFVRFGGESIVVAVWGPEIINRVESEAFAVVGVMLVVLGLVGGIFSLHRTARRMRLQSL